MILVSIDNLFAVAQIESLKIVECIIKYRKSTLYSSFLRIYRYFRDVEKENQTGRNPPSPPVELKFHFVGEHLILLKKYLCYSRNCHEKTNVHYIFVRKFTYLAPSLHFRIYPSGISQSTSQTVAPLSAVNILIS